MTSGACLASDLEDHPMRELNRLLSLTFGLDQRPTRSSFQIEQSRLDANAMAKAKRLAAKHGITIDKERKNANSCSARAGEIRAAISWG